MDTLDWTVRIDEISADGRDATRQASADELAALAKAANLIACEQFSANYTLTALSDDRIKLVGKITARGQQACVVTLDPVNFELDEDLTVTFVADEAVVVDDDDIEHEALSLDDVEPYSGTELKVGRVLYEHFCASLNPYPRVPGAAMDGHDVEDGGDDEKTHPFAALKDYKHKS